MSREEFMTALKAQLMDIPAEERVEALQYYEDYFDDAGRENEAEVIHELGSPQRVAENIQNGFWHTEEEGKFTENGYEDAWVPKREVPQSREAVQQDTRDEAGSYQESGSQNSNLWKILLIILIVLVAGPILFPIGIGVFGVIFGLLIAAVGFFAALVIASLAVVLAGFVMAVVGMAVGFAIHSIPAMLLMAGIGLVLIALGVLATVFTGKLCMVMYPAMFRFVVELCRKPFHRKAVSE